MIFRPYVLAFLRVVIEYRDPTTDKLYHHKIFLKKLTRDTKISDVLDYLKKKHTVYTRNIDPEQIESTTLLTQSSSIN